MFDNIKIMAVKIAINQFIDGIGTIRDLAIDNAKKKIVAQVDLIGEDKPVRVEVSGYSLGPDYIKISRFICDKPWIEAALNKFAANKEFKLPTKAMGLIKMII